VLILKKLFVFAIIVISLSISFGLNDIQNIIEPKPKAKIVEINTKESGPELKYFKGVIGSGKTIYEIFMEKKVSHGEIMNLIGSFSKIYDLRKVRENQKYSFLLTPLNKIKQFSYRGNFKSDFIAERKGEFFNVFKKDIKYSKKVVAKIFTIKDSLYNSIVSRQETGTLVNKIANIFSWDIDFYLDPKTGDKIKILYEKYYKGKKLIKYGNILSVQYIAKNRKFQAFFFKNGKNEGYYDEKGRPLKKMFLRLPLKFGRVTSRYSIRRFHPVDRKYRAHKGIDYGAPIGTPIFATADGIVNFSGRSGGYGKLVVLKNPNGYKTYYAHCSRLLVRRGTKIKQGQLIAKVGKTGKVTGPHVHYEIRYKNKPLNPTRMITSKSKAINKNLKLIFFKIKNERLDLVRSLLIKQKYYLSKMKNGLKEVRG
jgi:murein DD-endopeptidase MepM/ murein hydrolase activator NlpD